MLCINQTKIISLNSCRRLLIFILVMLLLGTAVTAQQSIDLIFHSGKIVKNYPRFPERTFSLLGSVAYNRKLNGEATWHQFYHNPEVTFQGTFGSLGNATEFGNIHSISGGYRFIYPINHKINLTAEARLGAAYFNHPFNEESNIDNLPLKKDNKNEYYNSNIFTSFPQFSRPTNSVKIPKKVMSGKFPHIDHPNSLQADHLNSEQTDHPFSLQIDHP